MERVIGNTILTFEELYSVLTQIEACLNSRPLMSLSNDPTDLQALIPGHFLIGEPLNSIPEEELTETVSNRLMRYQLLKQMRQTFWTRWSQEYITQLQLRFKWKRFNKENHIQEGTMVLIKQVSTPPINWPLGRIEKV